MPRALNVLTMTNTVKMAIVREYWVQSKPFASGSAGGGATGSAAASTGAGTSASGAGSSDIMRSDVSAVLDDRVSGDTCNAEGNN